MKISVVIPVYNVRDYLPGCLDSEHRPCLRRYQYSYERTLPPDRLRSFTECILR